MAVEHDDLRAIPIAGVAAGEMMDLARPSADLG
jgi:hypothetical protein